VLGTEGSIQLGEEEHQDRDVIYISCGKGCNSGDRCSSKPTHDAAFFTSCIDSGVMHLPPKSPNSGEIEIGLPPSLGGKEAKFMQLCKSYDSLIISSECLAGGNKRCDRCTTEPHNTGQM
jgi:hypothetical protein